MCHQSCNERQITLFTGMVDALWTVFRYCDRRGVNFFTRKEVKSLFTDENQTARFGDWILFVPTMVRRDGQKGHYQIDLQLCRDFFAGRLKIPTTVLKNPLTGTLRREDYKFIDEINKLSDFLIANREFIAVYRTAPQNSQMKLF